MLRPRLLSLPLLLAASSALAEWDGGYAEEDCTPCYAQCSQPSTFGAGGHWLYMRSLVGAKQVARKVTISNYSNLTGIAIDSQELCFDADHSSGFDLYAFYRSPPSCDEFSWELRGAFLAHRFDDSELYKPTSPAFLQPSLGLIPQIVVNFFSAAQVSFETDYESIRGQLGGTFSRNGTPICRLFAGLEYAKVKESLQILYQPSSFPIPQLESGSFTEVRQLSRFSGIGPMVGFSGQLPMLCGLSAFGELSTSVLYSKQTGSFEQETLVADATVPIPQSDLRLKDSFCPTHTLTPGVDAQVGLKLDFDFWGCFTLGISAAYRGIYYWDALNQLSITSSRLFADGETADFRDSQTSLTSQGYGLTGWVIGGSLQF